MIQGYSAHKDKLIERLHRIEGQARGIERMVENDRYCVDILTQLGAVSRAVESLAFEILDDHVNHCVTRAITSGNQEEATGKAEELLAAVHRFAQTR